MSYEPSYRRILHKMGFYDYQQGLIFRHLSQDRGWVEHELRCREYILKTVAKFSPRKITVLGSGWLLELPLSELAEKIPEIVLIDIVHPPEVREQVRRFANVSLIEDDLSGGLIREVWNKTSGGLFGKKIKSLSEIQVPEYDLQDPGLVISLNILTQLEALPVRRLESKSGASSVEIEGFRKGIQEKHLSLLRKHRSILISDIAEIFSGPGGDTEVRTLLAGLEGASDHEKWQWDFDLKGNDFNRKRSVMQVAAMTF